MSPSLATRMSAAKQLLKALEQLHSAGIVHQSELTPACRFLSLHANYSTDLNDRNVMWGIAPPSNFNTETKYRLLGRPKKRALSSSLWKRGELVKPLQVPKALLGETVYLSNFSMSIKAGTEVEHKVAWPIDYCAPERFHNVNPSFASDMWSYICLFTQLYLSITPWHHTGHYKAIGRCGDSWYDQNRKPKLFRTLEAQIRRLRPDVDPTERNHVLSVMSKGFSYLPKDRPSATQLLQDASFKAVMEIYCG